MADNPETEEDLVVLARSQLETAIQIVARKVELQPKAESGFEMHTRINSEKYLKKNKAVKRGAKKMVKRKEIKKMTAYFLKK